MIRSHRFHDADLWPMELAEEEYSSLSACHEAHIGRTELLKQIKLGLRETRGRGAFRFDMRISYNFMKFLCNSLRVNSGFQVPVDYQLDRSANYVKIVFDNGVVNMAATRDVAVYIINDVRLLEDVLGTYWYMAPLLDPNATIGNVSEIHHAFIPHENPNIRVQIDMDRLILKMLVPFVSKRSRNDILKHKVNFQEMLEHWQEEFTGKCVCDPEESVCYEVIMVEINHSDFVSIKTPKRGTPMSCVVAWLLPYDCYEFLEDPNLSDYCLIDRDIMLKHCIPFAPQDIEEFFPIEDEGMTVVINVKLDM